MTPAVVSAVEQVCSEFATAAVRARVPSDPDGDYGLVLVVLPHAIRVEVSDVGIVGEELAGGLVLAPLPLTGRALLLVEAHASAWWVETLPGERTVCAEFTTLTPSVGRDA